MGLGSLILMGLLQFAQVALRQIKASRERLRIEQCLLLAKEEMILRTRGQEPVFWETFPRVNEPVHPVGHRHGANDFHETCPFGEESACLTTWDLHLGSQAPLFHDVIEADYPHSVRLRPQDLGEGIFEEIKPMSVLLFYHPEASFCALVAECWADEVTLVPLEAQPWALPESMPGDVEVMLLGSLEVKHVRMEAERDRELLWRPWAWEEGSWQAGRRLRVDDVHALLFEQCNGSRPDRLTLVIQSPNARWLYEPYAVAGAVFEKEVAFASLEF